VAHRVVAYVDFEEYQKLKVALVLDEMSFSEWLRQQMTRYVQARLRGTLRIISDPAGSGGIPPHT